MTEHFADNDTNRANHNHMFIEHSDGTTAFYAHLVQDSVLPEVGDRVAQGELIAQSGTSGGTVAVLHFGVYRTWPVQGGDDVAINFRNADGPLDRAWRDWYREPPTRRCSTEGIERFPVCGDTYWAGLYKCLLV